LGVEETPAWFVYSFRGGLIASLENYLDRAPAEDAAGLSRRDGTA
jgi:ketosteroid isomerase-like protein